MKQKSICTIVSALFFTLAAPAILPFKGVFAIFPHISELYQSLEAFANGMIPDSIKRFVAALNQGLS